MEFIDSSQNRGMQQEEERIIISLLFGQKAAAFETFGKVSISSENDVFMPRVQP